MFATGLPEEARQFAGPMLGMVTQMGGMAFGTQLGQGLGHLAKDVLTSTDVGLPLAPTGTAVLLPEAIAKFADGLEQPAQEIIVFLAAARPRTSGCSRTSRGCGSACCRRSRSTPAGSPWTSPASRRRRSRSTRPKLLSKPGKIEELMSAGTSFEPTTSPGQEAALARLENAAGPHRGLGGARRRPRARRPHPQCGRPGRDDAPSFARPAAPAEQTFATLVGLELRPRKVREAAALWDKLLEASDIATRDGVWAHPDLMPDGDDVDSPAGFIDRVIGGGTDDPIAELEKQMAREATRRTRARSPRPRATSPTATRATRARTRADPHRPETHRACGQLPSTAAGRRCRMRRCAACPAPSPPFYAPTPPWCTG